MGLDVDRFGAIRPFLFHLTGRENIRRIKVTSVLNSAETLLSQAGRSELLRSRRVGRRYIALDNDSILLHDQDPLHAGAIAFEPGWDLGRFVGHVNRHVFFWPGIGAGPIESGRSHFERYASERPVVLRVGLYQLMVANRESEPLFCRFNSGAPRVVGGRHSPRGALTYQRAADFIGTPSDVVEVVFEHSVLLPNSTQIGASYDGPWHTLASATV
jgi:hypothetical protein